MTAPIARNGAAVAPRAPRRDRVQVEVARWALVVVAIGAFFSPPLSNLAGAVALVALLTAPSAGARLRAVWEQPLGRAAVLLIVVIAASMLWSAATWPARFTALWNWRALLMLLAGLAVFDEARARVRFALVFAVAVAVAVPLIIAGRFGLLPPRTTFEPGVYLRNTVTQAMVLGVAGYFAVMLAVTQRAWSRNARVALYGLALLLLGTLFTSGLGRSGHLATLIIVGATLLQYLRGWRFGAAALGVPIVGVAIAAAAPGVSQRFAIGWDELQTYGQRTELTSMGMRAVIWRTTGHLVAERPVLGYGLGGYSAAYEARVKTQYSDWKATPTTDPHNQYLFLLVESGIPGLLAFVGFLVAATRQRAPRPWRPMGIALLAAWCVTSLFSSHFQTFSEGHLIAVFMAAFLAREREADAAPAPPGIRTGTRVSLTAGAVQRASAESTAASTSA